MKRLRTCLAFVCFGLHVGVVSAQSQPNVVLFVVDDMGWADWQQRSDFYETPNMIRLANQGVSFTQAYASASVCSPTRASLHTGLSPAAHGITKWIPGNPANEQTNAKEPISEFNLDDDFVTLGEAMQQGGYHTAQIGKWHLGQNGNAAANPLNHGFDVNIGGNHRGQPPSYTDRNSYLGLPNLDNSINENYLTDHLAQEAQNYIEDRVASNETFFLNFNLYAVHTPIQGHPDHFGYFQNKQDGQVHSNAAYASMLKGMDEALGQLLDTLEAQQIDDETVVIFTSDNGGFGDATSNAPLRGTKGEAWEGGTRVPTIISGPGVQVGVESGYQTISHDLYPTILAMAGVEGDLDHNALVEGLDLTQVLAGNGPASRSESLFWHLPHPTNQGGEPYGAVVSGDWKFVENYDTGEQFLFNLADDLGEDNNLINTEENQAGLLRQELHDYLRETDAQLWEGFELLPVPEPSSMGMLIVGGLCISRRR